MQLIPNFIKRSFVGKIYYSMGGLGGDKINFSTGSITNNATADRCINKISKTLGNLPFDLYVHSSKSKNVKALSNRFYYTLERPNAEEGRSLFFMTLVRHMLTYGNAYVYYTRNRVGDIVSIQLVDPTVIKIERDSFNKKRFYVNGEEYKDILHIPYIDNYNGTQGFSPLDTYSKIISIDNQIMLYIDSFLHNSIGKRPYIKVTDDAISKNKKEAERFLAETKADLKEAVSAMNAGNLFSLPFGFEIGSVDTTFNLYDDLKSLKALTESMIAQAFGVPYGIISNDGSGNEYNSLEMKQLDFIEDTIKPLGDHIEDCFDYLINPIDERMIDPFRESKGFYTKFDYDYKISTDTKTRLDKDIQMLSKGGITLNEFRGNWGYDSIGPIGDIPIAYMSTIFPLTPENIDAYMAGAKLKIKEANNMEPFNDPNNTNHNPNGDDKA